MALGDWVLVGGVPTTLGRATVRRDVARRAPLAPAVEWLDSRLRGNDCPVAGAERSPQSLRRARSKTAGGPACSHAGSPRGKAPRRAGLLLRSQPTRLPFRPRDARRWPTRKLGFQAAAIEFGGVLSRPIHDPRPIGWRSEREGDRPVAGSALRLSPRRAFFRSNAFISASRHALARAVGADWRGNASG